MFVCVLCCDNVSSVPDRYCSFTFLRCISTSTIVQSAFLKINYLQLPYGKDSFFTYNKKNRSGNMRVQFMLHIIIHMDQLMTIVRLLLRERSIHSALKKRLKNKSKNKTHEKQTNKKRMHFKKSLGIISNRQINRHDMDDTFEYITVWRDSDEAYAVQVFSSIGVAQVPALNETTSFHCGGIYCVSLQ